VALTSCRECKGLVSASAKTCPHCGVANPAVSVWNRRIGCGTVIVVVIVFWLVFSSLNGEKNGEVVQQQSTTGAASASPQRFQPSQPKETPVNFDLPLQTTRGTLVCPSSALFDNREGHGLQAAMESRSEIFGRQKDAERAGCEEWREGVPIWLSDEEKQQAKKWQANHNCGMLAFGEGYVFSCDLRNTSDQKINPESDQSTVPSQQATGQGASTGPEPKAATVPSAPTADLTASTGAASEPAAEPPLSASVIGSPSVTPTPEATTPTSVTPTPSAESVKSSPAVPAAPAEPKYSPPPVTPQTAQPYVEQSGAQTPAAPQQTQGYWYYCAASRAYYPYVGTCPEGWQRVLPQAR